MVSSGSFLRCWNFFALNSLAKRLVPVAEEKFLPVTGQGPREFHGQVDEEDQGCDVDSYIEKLGIPCL